jgi:DNA polymerase-3 subunit beta
LGRALFEYVSQLPEGELLIEKLGEELVVTLGGYSSRFATMEPEEFPAIPKTKGEKTLTFKSDGFLKGVSLVVFNAALDESRPILTGVLGVYSKGKLEIVATDGYRLGHFEITATSKDNEQVSLIIPSKSLLEVAKIVSEFGDGKEGSELKMIVADNLSQINFRIGNVEYTSRLIEGEYPNWQKIIPSSFTTRVIISKLEFVKIVKIASIFARESGNIVKLKLEKRTLRPGSGQAEGGVLGLSAATSAVGSTNAQVEVKMEGSGGEIAFNFRYLLESLAAIDGEEVVFEMNESLNPGKITNIDGKDKFFHIIMPVRLQN